MGLRHTANCISREHLASSAATKKIHYNWQQCPPQSVDPASGAYALFKHWHHDSPLRHHALNPNVAAGRGRYLGVPTWGSHVRDWWTSFSTDGTEN